MSKMKHLLRKLHIGGGINDHQRLGSEIQPLPDPTPDPIETQSSGRIVAVESAGEDRTAGDASSGAADFNFLEEEFQVQLALAISASDTGAREDPESAQIDAAKRISLGCSMTRADAESDAVHDTLSLRYWSHNIMNYNEKVKDGFYDVYDTTSSSLVKGKMPLLMDLQAIPVSDNANYEVVLVNRLLDPELRELEKRACILSIESQVCGGMFVSCLIQKIAEIVVSRMGGPVDDADEVSRRWVKRRRELQNARNSTILLLGSLDIGLSRHRALLFKVLADSINLPCMLVKGSYYTGTDDGAVNLINIDDGSEYIIDLMGAPGTLIPAEVPSSHLPNAGYRGASECPSFLDNGRCQALPVSPNLDVVPDVGSLMPEEALLLGVKANKIDVDGTERDVLDKVFSSPLESSESSSGTKHSKSAQDIKVSNVSKYVISAAKDPEFAQKLHAVLLESGASPPADLFLDFSPQNLAKEKQLQQVYLANELNLEGGFQCHLDDSLSRGEDCFLNNYYEESAKWSTEKLKSSGLNVEECKVPLQSNDTIEGFVDSDNGMNKKRHVGSTCLDLVPVNRYGMFSGRFMHENRIHESLLYSAMPSCQIQSEQEAVSENDRCSQARNGTALNMGTKESVVGLIEATSNSLHNYRSDYSDKVHPVLGEVAEWEVPWEDLQIGERIGIGSCGEVYRADWNGTEVAVKKFLDQDISGDALIQYKYEAEIMLRLRHPNVVLFMGAVTRPPHLSILTEYLPRGSLYKLLHRSNPKLDEKRRMKMALDIAKGMNYLHTSHPPIVHRDLKSPNLLVDKNWVVKVCDFGLSRLKHHTFLSSKSTAGTPEWMAPEVLRNEPANEKCDVYSFGVILWELATCDIPWKGMNPMQVVGAVGFQNRRLEIPDSICPVTAQIVKDCWQTDPHLRPSFSQLISRLRRIQHV